MPPYVRIGIISFPSGGLRPAGPLIASSTRQVTTTAAHNNAQHALNRRLRFRPRRKHLSHFGRQRGAGKRFLQE